LVEEAVKVGIEEIIFVIGRGKRAIEDHFDHSFELQKTLVEKNKLNLSDKIQKIDSLAKFSYIRQPEPLGDGHAIKCAAHLVNNEPVLIMFGDTLHDAVVPPTVQLMKSYNKYKTSIVGLSEVAKSEVSKFGVIDGKEVGPGVYKINKFVEKPKPEKAPSNLVAVGLYIITPEIFKILEKMSDGKSGEIRLADAFDILLNKKRPLHGLKLKGGVALYWQ